MQCGGGWSLRWIRRRLGWRFFGACGGLFGSCCGLGLWPNGWEMFWRRNNYVDDCDDGGCDGCVDDSDRNLEW